MLVEGLQVMLVGVGAVFAFLGLLVATLGALGAAVSVWERVRPADRRPDGGEDELAAVAAAVAAAVVERRKE
ncbi:MAG: sodium pump decarboxylase subunit gamma [Candidatus Bipolaricaulota bacterium]